MSLTKHFEPTQIEEKWYAHWMDKNYFRSIPDEREPFSIVMPPPNVTGILHMGHMLNITIQDVLIRRARMMGKNACWVPGTDHASIATEAKVVRWLREEKNLKKSDLTREEFLKYAWEWTDKYGGIILGQLKKIGASCDWERTAFTLDEDRSKAVIKAFVDLYNSGKLYRDWRMVNWDPEAQTVLSNEEVIHNDENGHLYHLKYYNSDKSDAITIATTRPETILADAAIAVHPDDDRYKKWIGKSVFVPLINRKIPIIADDYVDIEFGSGALKITPAHDVNDYNIGQKHKLEVIDILTDDGKLNEKAQLLIGEDRRVARKKIKTLLEEAGNLAKVEDYRHSVGRSERTNAVVEPKLSLQWYVDMKALAQPALEAVQSDYIQFHPENQKNLYRHWMENIQDWCVSRQLWWGHQVPAYFYKDEVFVATSRASAMSQAREKFPDIKEEELVQDEDALDTWFSSWLWPISVFNGFEDRTELDYYYPTNVLVTGWDIIFLWVARMAMAGFEWEKTRPFEHVYFTGMVRDKKRRKMSKSLGNSPDVLKLMEKFGADGVRFGTLSSSPAGGDLLFDEKLCEQGRNFCNKMWNAQNLILSFDADENKPISEKEKLAHDWMHNRINNNVNIFNQRFEKFKLAEILKRLYQLIWNDFCGEYLEIIKPARGEKISRDTLKRAIGYYEQLLALMHPFMPFITEEIFHNLDTREEGQDLIVSKYPTGGDADEKLLKSVNKALDIITGVRDLRNKNGVSQNDELKLFAEENNSAKALLNIDGMQALLMARAKVSEIRLVNEAPAGSVAFVIDTDKYYVDLGLEIDEDAERERLEEELKYQEGFKVSVEKKLSNERFVSGAPAVVVDKERKKLSDALARIDMLKESLENLK